MAHPQVLPLRTKKKKGVKMSKARKIFLYTFLLFILLIGGLSAFLAYEASKFIHTPANSSAQEIVLEIEKGSSLKSIAKKLEKHGIISNAFYFELYTKYEKQQTKLKAGTFLLSASWSPEEILIDLVEGKTILHKITIREGLPWWTVAEILEEQGFCKAEDFKAIIHNKDFLEKNNIPFANAEGFLYPETYLIPKPKEIDKEDAQVMAQILVDSFWSTTKEAWKKSEYKGIPDSTELKKIMILASIVERETRLNEERPRVAGVYHNRLKINMILQADPTVIYGLGEEFKGQLLRKHLKDARNKYNTYQHGGLPPGPICSPSLMSIEASLNPESHKYYYFVAKGIGASHVFSKNLSQHNRAVYQYRQNLKKQQ